jgi:8-oxo-dGTP pyrophosphatase MutT (NUDIX family)
MNENPGQWKEQVKHILADRSRSVLDDPTLICAAVLIPLVFEQGLWHVLVTQRTRAVQHHKGQMSFPGGACEPDDETLQATALRETFEEIGVPPAGVEVLGVLDDFPTITNFAVTPFVGVVPSSFSYRLNHSEVESIVKLPLPFVLDPTHLRIEQWDYRGQPHDVLFWDYDGYTIWGLTARILKTFLDLVF